MLFNKLLRKATVYSHLTWRKCTEVKRCSQIVFQTLTRSLSDTVSEQPVMCRLASRGLVRVKGPDTIPFLQGLVTNDVTLLQQQAKSIYAMLLNVQGRVEYDLILYNVTQPEDDTTLLLECDHSLVDELVKDIKKYKIRKKVSIEPAGDLIVYAKLGQPSTVPHPDNIVIQTEDPRVPQFGARIIVNEEVEGNKETFYHENRLKWGIPEGPVDLPIGNCLPLECNLVYMNGVSFSKGCYLGQELTARTHHTGVIRKRLMPVTFTEPPDEIEPGENIVNEQSKSVGKFRSCIGQNGLGLMRIAGIKGELSVKTKTGTSVKVTAMQPYWWPLE